MKASDYWKQTDLIQATQVQLKLLWVHRDLTCFIQNMRQCFKDIITEIYTSTYRTQLYFCKCDEKQDMLIYYLTLLILFWLNQSVLIVFKIQLQLSTFDFLTIITELFITDHYTNSGLRCLFQIFLWPPVEQIQHTFKSRS